MLIFLCKELLMKKKFVIFDMDGVIFNTEVLWRKAIAETNKKFNVNITEELRVHLCGRSDKATRQILTRKFPNPGGNVLRDYMCEYVKNIKEKEGIKLKPGFLELIDFLKTKKIKLGLATGSNLDEVHAYFNGVGLDEHKIFASILTSKQVIISKPNGLIYKTSCENLGAKPEECFVIEDSPNGVMAAKNAGCTPILVVDTMLPTKYEKSICEKVFNDLIELKAYLETQL